MNQSPDYEEGDSDNDRDEEFVDEPGYKAPPTEDEENRGHVSNIDFKPKGGKKTLMFSLVVDKL